MRHLVPLKLNTTIRQKKIDLKNFKILKYFFEESNSLKANKAIKSNDIFFASMAVSLQRENRVVCRLLTAVKAPTTKWGANGKKDAWRQMATVVVGRPLLKLVNHQAANGNVATFGANFKFEFFKKFNFQFSSVRFVTNQKEEDEKQ
jgi:hypothetical protein